MGKKLSRTLWAARLVTVALGVVVIVALLNMQSNLPASGNRRHRQLHVPAPIEAPQPATEAENGIDDVLDGVLDGEEDGGVDGQQQESFSLARLSQMLGWAAESKDGMEESAEMVQDRIRWKDWKPLDEMVPGPGLGHMGTESTTEWWDSPLLKAFVARFGAASQSLGDNPTTRGPQDVDGGEMADFVAYTTTAVTTTNAQDAKESPATLVVTSPTHRASPALPEVTSPTRRAPPALACPLNGIITTQEGEGIGDKFFGYLAAWLVSRVAGVGWRTAVVPDAVLTELSQLFADLSLPSLEQLPSSCRPSPQLLESSGMREGDLLGDLPSLPTRVVNPQAPIVVHRDALLIDFASSHLASLRDEFALRPELQMAGRMMLDECRRQKRQDRDGKDDDDDTTAFVAVHAHRGRRRHAAAPWLPLKYRQPVSADYFRSAMEYFRSRSGSTSRPLFVVVSDDVAWVRANLAGPDVCAVDSLGTPETELTDLAVLASCRHSITDRSTTSLAAAMLAMLAATRDPHGDTLTVSPRMDLHHAHQLGRLPGWTFLL